jgi:hypothetical protein
MLVHVDPQDGQPDFLKEEIAHHFNNSYLILCTLTVYMLEDVFTLKLNLIIEY